MTAPSSSIRRGIEAETRERLEVLHRNTTGSFKAAEAGRVWSMDLVRARRLLAHLAAKGWLVRVKQGLYATVPLGAAEPADWREDTWVVAVRSFTPCYIAGWSACEHWGLTEQIFRDIAIVTGQPVRKSPVAIQGTAFHLRHRSEDRLFGTRIVWRDRVQVPVSDPSRTIVDILDKPDLGAGIRHVADVIETYFAGEHRNERLLLEYAERAGNRTVYKRLGYLMETLGIDVPDIVERCRSSLSAGLTFLDPTLRRAGRISKRWNLRVNVEIKSGGEPT